MAIEGSADKRSISLHGELSHAGKKIQQSLPRFKFPNGFSLSANPKHFSNTEESLKYLKKIIVPYVQKQRELLEYPTNQKALGCEDILKTFLMPLKMLIYA